MGAAKNNIWAILEGEGSGNDASSQIPFSSFVVDTSLPLPLMVPRIIGSTILVAFAITALLICCKKHKSCRLWGPTLISEVPDFPYRTQTTDFSLDMMVVEPSMIYIDNSEWMRKGDYRLTEAVNLLCSAKTQSNPKNTVGILTMADWQVKELES